MSSQIYFQWKACSSFDYNWTPFCPSCKLDILLFFHTTEFISSQGLSSFYHLPQRKSFPYLCWITSSSWKEQAIPLTLGERQGCKTMHVSMVIKENPCLAKTIIFWLHVVFFSELAGTLQHGNSPPFSCPARRAIQECRFHIFPCQFNNLSGEGR